MLNDTDAEPFPTHGLIPFSNPPFTISSLEGMTVTVQVAVFPSIVAAVIVAVPFALAFIVTLVVPVSESKTAPVTVATSDCRN